MAQWGHVSEAAASLARMAARSARGSPELALLMRERQDLVAEWRAEDKQLISARSEKALFERLATIGVRLAEIDVRLAEIDVRLAKDFPD